jgi:hypothetical protein
MRRRVSAGAHGDGPRHGSLVRPALRLPGRTNPKKHAFSLPDVDVWTVLELDLARTRG